MQSIKRAALILIGNEILSGKVQDLNAQHLIKRFREWGVDLARIAIVQDRIEDIASEVRLVRDAFDFVITSGGIGPTHDDVTYDAIAAAFGVPLEMNAEIEQCIRKSRKETVIKPEVFRMAKLPKGSVLVPGGDLGFPTTKFNNFYILPGVPQLFRIKIDALADVFRSEPFCLHTLYLNSDEGSIADLMGQTEKEFGVQIGSYPIFTSPLDYRLCITIEGKDPKPVKAAADALCLALKDRLVRRDPA